jgi:predicted ATPase/DNA-binding winged helix-turn-helix (wHTH) protein
MDVIRLGTFELHPAERRLLDAGRPVDIGARAFDLLLVLAETPGRLVTKATLLDRVWPRLVVDENNLPTQVAALRKILGASSIQTVPGFGYRLEMPGTAAASPPEPALPPALTIPAVPRQRSWPERLASLIGRDDDLTRIEEQLGRARFVTIVGTPGVGKSRLAEEILDRERVAPASDAVFVPLAPVPDVSLVPMAIAAALGLTLDARSDGFDALARALSDASALIVLDSVEHLAEPLATHLATLVSRQRRLRVLVTSQIPLGVVGEVVYRLGPLALPRADGVDAANSAAVDLFAQRAAAADRSFALGPANAALVADICRRLDGNPLALELAAARVAALGVAALHARLDDRMRLLRSAVRGGDSRHGALQAAFEWSYGLLTAREQRAFDRVGILAGSFPLGIASTCIADAEIDDVEAIDLIARLVDRSLVTALPGDPPRYAMSETARCYAREQLAARGDLANARANMASAVLRQMDTAYTEYWFLDEATWRRRYLPEIDNVRAALAWATDADPGLAISLYGSTWPLFVEAELLVEARAAYDQQVCLLADSLPLARLGRFWEAAATYHSMARFDRARYSAELAARMHGETGDDRARYYALTQLVTNWRSDNAAARDAFAAARRLENASWPPRLLTQGALTEGALLMAAGQLDAAREASRRAVRLALAVSERQALAATVRLVELDLACGDLDGALQLGRALTLSLRHSTHYAMLMDVLTLLFGAQLRRGNVDDARATGFELYRLASRLDPGRLHAALDGMTLLACIEGNYEVAARVADDADRALEARGLERRRPADVPLRDAAERLLEAHLGASWQVLARQTHPRRDEAHSCGIVLGLDL